MDDKVYYVKPLKTVGVLKKKIIVLSDEGQDF